MKLSMGKLILVLITFTMTSCYSDYKFKERLIGEFYLIEDESIVGKSLVTMQDGAPAATLVNGRICEVYANSDFIILKRSKEKDSEYYYIDVHKVEYPEDMQVINKEAYNGFKSRSVFTVTYTFD